MKLKPGGQNTTFTDFNLSLGYWASTVQQLPTNSATHRLHSAHDKGTLDRRFCLSTSGLFDDMGEDLGTGGEMNEQANYVSSLSV